METEIIKYRSFEIKVTKEKKEPDKYNIKGRIHCNIFINDIFIEYANISIEKHGNDIEEMILDKIDSKKKYIDKLLDTEIKTENDIDNYIQEVLVWEDWEDCYFPIFATKILYDKLKLLYENN